MKEGRYSIPPSRYSAPVGGVIEVALSGGEIALIDEADKTIVENGRWRVVKNKDGGVYVIRYELRRPILMHRQILNPPASMQVDHINRCGLDNRRINLRVCTSSQNCRNRGPKGGRKFKGIQVEDNGRFRATITDGRARITIGTFDTDIEAAAAYDAAARNIHGEFVWLNFPDGAH